MEDLVLQYWLEHPVFGFYIFFCWGIIFGVVLLFIIIRYAQETGRFPYPKDEREMD